MTQFPQAVHWEHGVDVPVDIHVAVMGMGHHDFGGVDVGGYIPERTVPASAVDAVGRWRLGTVRQRLPPVEEGVSKWWAVLDSNQ